MFRKDVVLNRAEQVLADPAAEGLDLGLEYRTLAESYGKLHHKLHKTLVISDTYQLQTKELAVKLDQSALKLQQLSEVALPICVYCHKMRTTDNYWEKLETFFSRHVDILFSHGICPDCLKSAYGKMGERVLAKTQEAAPVMAEQAGRRASAEPVKDESLREMRALLERAAADGNPLTHDIERIVDRYAKLQRRFDKIVSISDSYQSQLREFNMRLELMARTDLLTGLCSRWEITTRLDTEKSRAERHKKPFSIIMADVDRFKAINDTYGHLAGDRVLREIAECLKKNCRTEDVCARWGGDEFMVLLPETDYPRALAAAKKLDRALAGLNITWERQIIAVSMSLGVEEFVPGSSTNELIQHVDDALYASKRKRRSGEAGSAP